MQYIIDFIDTITPEAVEEYCVRNSCTIVKSFNNFDTYLVEAENAPPVEEIVTAVVEDASAPLKLLSAIPTKSFPIDEDDNWWKPVVLSGVDLDQPTATIARAGQGVRVYVMDSGIRADHAEFSGKDVTLLHSVTPGDFSDTNGHGTAIASVIVGETCGITEASLKVVKIFHQGHQTLISEMIEAFDAVASDYLEGEDFLAVLNLSWSINKNAYVESKIAALMDMGLLVVASAGNEGRPIADVTPACMADALTIGSFGKDLEPSDFSNYTISDSDVSFTEGGTNYGALDAFAPGEQIRIALPDGTYGVGMGTSLAAAISSAVLALRIRASGMDWSLADFSAQDFLNAVMTRDILTLAGNFANAPNAIPAENVSRLAGRVRAMRLFPVPAGERRHVWLFDGNINSNAVLTGAPAWVSLVNSQLSFDAPALTTNESFRGTVTMTNGEGEEETFDFVIVVLGDSNETWAEYYEDHPAEINFANLPGGIGGGGSHGNQYECDQQCMNQGMPYCCQCCGDKFSSTCNQCSNFQCSDQACNA